MVVRLFLRAAGRLLRLAAAARSDGHRRRREESALAVHRLLRLAAGGATALRRAGRTAAARALYPHRLSFLRRQYSLVLGADESKQPLALLGAEQVSHERPEHRDREQIE